MVEPIWFINGIYYVKIRATNTVYIYIYIKYLFDVLGMIEDLEAALLAFPQSSHIISLASKSG